MPLSLRVVLDAWRGITLQDVRVTFLCGTGYFLLHVILYFGNASYHGLGLFLLFVLRQAGAFALLLCVVVADRVTGKDPQRRAAYLGSVLVGSAVGGIVVPRALDLVRGVTWPIEVTLYVHFFELALLGAAAVMIYIDRRAAQAALARMQAAELERVETSRHVLESRLQAMQARVEPQFLFNTLAQVKLLYEKDAVRAERVLDELIAYLRAAMPRMRDTSSTLSREIELVRAYLSIARVRLDDRLDFSIDLPAEAVDASVPPMMLLPIVDRALGHEHGRECRNLRIAVSCEDGMLRFTIADDGPGMTARGDKVFDDIGERLATLYGVAAGLTFRSRNNGGEALLWIPFDPVCTA